MFASALALLSSDTHPLRLGFDVKHTARALRGQSRLITARAETCRPYGRRATGCADRNQAYPRRSTQKMRGAEYALGALCRFVWLFFELRT